MIERCLPIATSGITRRFQRLSRSSRHVAYVLLRRSPLDIATPFDLHVLGTPPAFVLSHDQTLRKNCFAILSGCLSLLNSNCLPSRTNATGQASRRHRVPMSLKQTLFVNSFLYEAFKVLCSANRATRDIIGRSYSGCQPLACFFFGKAVRKQLLVRLESFAGAC